MNITADPGRLWMAAAALSAYLALCMAIVIAQVRKRRVTAQFPQDGMPEWIVVYASQTGNAEELAHQTVASLQLAGLTVWPCSLSQW